jgi:hypothetical protein
MWTSRTFDQRGFPDRKITLISREACALLQEQERLLDLPMSAADLLLYEMRVQQITDLIQHLVDKNDSPTIRWQNAAKPRGFASIHAAIPLQPQTASTIAA